MYKIPKIDEINKINAFIRYESLMNPEPSAIYKYGVKQKFKKLKNKVKKNKILYSKKL